MIWKWKRPAAFLLAAAMIFTMPGVPASAVEAGVSAVHTGLCKHHPEHTEDCGYTEGTEGAACKHEHTEDCYTLVKKCIHNMTKAVPLFWKAAYQKIRRPHLKQRRPSRPRVPMNAARKAAVSKKN